MTESSNDDRAFVSLLGAVLRFGVLTAAVIVAAGGLIYVYRQGSLPVDYTVFRSQPAEFRSAERIIAHAASGSGRGLIQFGLLLLIATPILRVVFSIGGFLRERDFTYVAITLTVLALLAYSLLAT